jgi:8-oxo-dGTP pyrophosphatase MutT (NUDIX family)
MRGLHGKSWCDVVDEHNQPLGYRLPIDWITDRGRWHRGVRIILRSPAGNYLLEKRTSSIVFAPDMLDLSLGGLMDAGEVPLEAARREAREELGLQLAAAELVHLADLKWHSYHPHSRKHSRVFLTCYLATVPEDFDPVLQPEEVAAAYWLSPGQVKRLIRHHSLRRFGRLMYGYKHWWQLISQVEANAKP